MKVTWRGAEREVTTLPPGSAHWSGELDRWLATVSSKTENCTESRNARGVTEAAAVEALRQACAEDTSEPMGAL